jgi:hypothetical protein
MAQSPIVVDRPYYLIVPLPLLLVVFDTFENPTFKFMSEAWDI